jgi:hypothetical protein
MLTPPCPAAQFAILEACNRGQCIAGVPIVTPALYVLFRVFLREDLSQRTDEEVAYEAHPGGRPNLKLRACP